MHKKNLWIAIGIAILLIIGMFNTITRHYNQLVTLETSVQTQRANLEAVYQRRADLIPNIVATVKGKANFEQETLHQVVEARASATQLKVNLDNAQDLANYQSAQGNLSQALGKLLMISENYPNLQSNQGFKDLRVQLEGAENRITVERMNYNKTVQNYNIKLRSFPSNIIAKYFNFQKAMVFDAPRESEQAPTINF